MDVRISGRREELLAAGGQLGPRVTFGVGDRSHASAHFLPQLLQDGAE
ncbi:hypothetical protein ACTMTU_05740 [Streptomyces sp. OZ13]